MFVTGFPVFFRRRCCYCCCCCRDRLGVKEDALPDYYRKKEENYRKVHDATPAAPQPCMYQVSRSKYLAPDRGGSALARAFWGGGAVHPSEAGGLLPQIFQETVVSAFHGRPPRLGLFWDPFDSDQNNDSFGHINRLGAARVPSGTGRRVILRPCRTTPCINLCNSDTNLHHPPTVAVIANLPPP